MQPSLFAVQTLNVVLVVLISQIQALFLTKTGDVIHMLLYSFNQQSATHTIWIQWAFQGGRLINTLIRACRYKNQPLIIYYLEIMCFSASTYCNAFRLLRELCEVFHRWYWRRECLDLNEWSHLSCQTSPKTIFLNKNRNYKQSAVRERCIWE